MDKSPLLGYVQLYTYLPGGNLTFCIKASPQQPAPPPSPSSESGDRGIFKNIYYIRNHCFQRSISNNSTSNICCSCFLSHNVLFLSGKASCVRFFADGSRSTCEQRLFPDFLCLLLSSKRKHRDGPRPKRSPTFLTSPLYKMLYSIVVISPGFTAWACGGLTSSGPARAHPWYYSLSFSH